MWSIRILSGQQSGQIFDLKLGKNVFGRGGISDFKVISLGISKEHCEIYVYKDKLMIVDLKSSNGTFVNGVKIQNSLIRIGDKISLFDVIMDLIPTPDLRPKNNLKIDLKPLVKIQPQVDLPQSPAIAAPQMPTSYPQPMMMGYQEQVPFQGQMAYQLNSPQKNATILQAVPPEPEKAQKALNEKVEDFIENVMMPAIYKLGIIFSFKQVLVSFIIIFIFGVTLLSMFPLVTMIKESNLIEATKRSRSVARALAKVNEQALLSGQLTNLSVSDALKEEGIKEAFIIQHSDGAIVAPSEKAGRETVTSFILKARKESRATVGSAGSGLLGASHPIGVYDPSTGEPTIKYHAIVIYDVSSLSFNEERLVSLFMQTICIAAVLGLLLYFLFARFIEYPLKSLNEQIDKALIDQSDRTEVLFDYPTFQKLVSNVNTLLNRIWNGGTDQSDLGPQQNKDLEFSNLVEMISHPALVIDINHRVVAINSNFEQLAQTNKDILVNSPYQSIPDTALVQNIEALILRSLQSPQEKHEDKIPFSQFECHIYCQAFLNQQNTPEFFIFTLIQAEAS